MVDVFLLQKKEKISEFAYQLSAKVKMRGN